MRKEAEAGAPQGGGQRGGAAGLPCSARPWRRLCSAGSAARSGRRGLGRRGRAVSGEGARSAPGAALGAGRGSVSGQPFPGAGSRTGSRRSRAPRGEGGASCPPRKASHRRRGDPRAEARWTQAGLPGESHQALPVTQALRIGQVHGHTMESQPTVVCQDLARRGRPGSDTAP